MGMAAATVAVTNVAASAPVIVRVIFCASCLMQQISSLFAGNSVSRSTNPGRVRDVAQSIADGDVNPAKSTTQHGKTVCTGMGQFFT
jgi:hypothetical protein